MDKIKELEKRIEKLEETINLHKRLHMIQIKLNLSQIEAAKSLNETTR